MHAKAGERIFVDQSREIADAFLESEIDVDVQVGGCQAFIRVVGPDVAEIADAAPTVGAGSGYQGATAFYPL
jgi:hypothetical protein